MRRIDLTGQKFGRLTILKSYDEHKSGRSAWKCLCECGNVKNVLMSCLKQGGTKSCGCLNKEQIIITGLKSFKGDGVSGFNLLYNSYIKSAKKRNFKFELSKDEFKKLTSSNCHYCNRIPRSIKSLYNLDISQATKLKCRYIYNGIDRIDNNKGYILINCVTCCSICNRGKSNLTYDEFISYIKQLVNFQKGNNI